MTHTLRSLLSPSRRSRRSLLRVTHTLRALLSPSRRSRRSLLRVTHTLRALLSPSRRSLRSLLRMTRLGPQPFETLAEPVLSEVEALAPQGDTLGASSAMTRAFTAQRFPSRRL